MSQSDAVEVTLEELERLGRLERIDEARVEMLRGLAGALDSRPNSPGLWQQYREALEDMLNVNDDAGPLEELLEEMRTSVRDEETA